MSIFSGCPGHSAGHGYDLVRDQNMLGGNCHRLSSSGESAIECNRGIGKRVVAGIALSEELSRVVSTSKAFEFIGVKAVDPLNHGLRKLL